MPTMHFGELLPLAGEVEQTRDPLLIKSGTPFVAHSRSMRTAPPKMCPMKKNNEEV
jgi:hypothetical protein